MYIVWAVWRRRRQRGALHSANNPSACVLCGCVHVHDVKRICKVGCQHKNKNKLVVLVPVMIQCLGGIVVLPLLGANVPIRLDRRRRSQVQLAQMVDALRQDSQVIDTAQQLSVAQWFGIKEFKNPLVKAK